MPSSPHPAGLAGDTPMLLFQAEGLGQGYPGLRLFHDLSLAIGPGVTLVRGGDGCGKTTLLRLMAGDLEPQVGRVQQRSLPVWYERPADAEHDAVVARDWLQSRLPPGAPAPDALIDGFGLREHLDKPLFMLSTGSRRKLGLVGAAACGAPLVLLDTPFAALDTPSSRRLNELLARAARDPQKAWVVADHEPPRGLLSTDLAGVIDLGDEPGGPVRVHPGSAPPGTTGP